MKEGNQEGVYYRQEDYAGVWVRLLIEGIDVFVALTVCLVFSVLLLAFLTRDDLLSLALVISWILVWFMYFVIMKRTRIRTLGYIIGGVRIVNLQGASPSLASLSIRLLFAMLGPFNAIIDLMWAPGDNHRQALRDKFAGTYVIKKNARPVGQGKIIHAEYSILAWNFIFREVSELPATVK